MIDFVADLQAQKAEEALESLQQLFKMGKEASRLVEEWLEFARDLLVAKQSGEAVGRSERFLQFKDEVDASFLYRFVEALNQTQQEMRFTTKPTISLEVLTIKMAQPQKSATPRAIEVPSSEEVEQLQQQLAQLRQQMSALMQGGIVPSSQPAPPKPVAKTPKASFKPNVSAVNKILMEATKEDIEKVRDLWGDLLSCLTPQQRALMNQAQPVAAGPNGFVMQFMYEHICGLAETTVGFHEEVQGHLERLGGYSGTFVGVTSEQWQQIRSDFVLERKKNKEGEAVSHVTEAPVVEEPISEEEQEFKQKVQDTIELFGEEFVQIEE